MTNKAPLKDLWFNNTHIAFIGADPETASAVLAEVGRFCAEEIVPSNLTDDRAGSDCEGGTVRTAPGFRNPYSAFDEMGWQMARAVLAAEVNMAGDPHLMAAKIDSAHFYAQHHLPETTIQGLRVTDGALSFLHLTF